MKREIKKISLAKFWVEINDFSELHRLHTGDSIRRIASVGILRKEREPGVSKIGWYGNFDTGFESSKSRVRDF